MVDTRYRSIYSSITAGSFSPPGGSKQTRAPTNDHQNNSQTETSTKTVSFVGLYPPQTMGIFLHPL